MNETIELTDEKITLSKDHYFSNIKQIKHRNNQNKSWSNSNFKTVPIRNISNIQGNQNKTVSLISIKDLSIELSSNIVKKNYNVKQIIKNKNNTLSKWKDFDINNVIKRDTLTSTNPDIMLFKSELMKYSSSSNRSKSFLNYCSKFCLLTKNDFFVFPSKETFLRLQNPTSKFSLNCIENYGRIDPSNLKLKINKEFSYFFIKIDLKRLKKNEFNKADQQYKEKFVNQEFKRLNILPISNISPIRKKNPIISLLKRQDLKEKNIKTVNLSKFISIDENYFLFASEDEYLINQWVFLINHYTHVNKN